MYTTFVAPSYSVIYYIYIPGTPGPCFHYWCVVYGISKCSDALWHVGRVRLFAIYTISLSSLCRLILRHWTTKVPVRYMLASVCLRLRQFYQLSFIQYMGLCASAYPIRSSNSAEFSPQPPGALVRWGTEWPKFNSVIQGNIFHEQWHLIPQQRMKNTIFPHTFWRPFLDGMPQLFFRPKYVWFPVYL